MARGGRLGERDEIDVLDMSCDNRSGTAGGAPRSTGGAQDGHCPQLGAHWSQSVGWWAPVTTSPAAMSRAAKPKIAGPRRFIRGRRVPTAYTSVKPGCASKWHDAC
jgi:hypothetical protein